MGEREVFLVRSQRLTRLADRVPANEGRQLMVDQLVDAYGVDATPVAVERATRDDLLKFHSVPVVDALLKVRPDEHDRGEADDSEDEFDDIDEELRDEIEQEVADTDVGLIGDCYPFDLMRFYVLYMAGAALAAAKAMGRKLASNRRIVMNWYGGRHHAHKTKLLGFCYVNDIVLSIQQLRVQGFRRIFYLDVDLHHGDGVEHAYDGAGSVFTCSIHRYDVGFFPGTGEACVTPEKANFPTAKGLSDQTLLKTIVDKVLPLITEYQPEALVICAGADGLCTDKYREWNLTIPGLCDAITTAINHSRCPVLLVGGGGYNHRETSKFWAYLTHVLCGLTPPQPEDYLPEHPSLDEYEGDSFMFWTPKNLLPGKMVDENV